MGPAAPSPPHENRQRAMPPSADRHIHITVSTKRSLMSASPADTTPCPCATSPRAGGTSSVASAPLLRPLSYPGLAARNARVRLSTDAPSGCWVLSLCAPETPDRPLLSDSSCPMRGRRRECAPPSTLCQHLSTLFSTAFHAWATEGNRRIIAIYVVVLCGDETMRHVPP